MSAPPGLEGQRRNRAVLGVDRRVAKLRRELAAEYRQRASLRRCPGPLPLSDDVYGRVLEHLDCADFGRIMCLSLAAGLQRHRGYVQRALASHWLAKLLECSVSPLPVRYRAVLYRTSCASGARWLVAEEALLIVARQLGLRYRRFTVRRTRHVGLLFPNPWPAPRLLPWAQGRGMQKHLELTLALQGGGGAFM